MAVVRWRFDDPSNSDTYTFSVNPTSGGSPSYQKNFDYSKTSAQSGKTIVFQGRNQPQKLTFEGTIFDETAYDAMVLWFNKMNQVQITDDLGRSFYIIIESFVPKRERAVQYPFKHSYTVNATIVNWA